jgi:hypothetical protein
MNTDTNHPSPDLRQLAIDRLRKRREFFQHLIVYVVVNIVLGAIWFITTPDGFYWPVFPLFAWGIGLVFHALDVFSSVFSSAPPSDERIEREITRLTGR